MGLQRTASQHQTTASQHEAVVSADYADFAVGDRVDTVDGFLGTVTAVDDGPFPGTEQYQVTLDSDMGGGEYTSSQLTKVHTTEAAGLTPQQEFANGVAETYNGLGGNPPISTYEASTATTAAADYPELAEILVDRPPLAHAEPLRMSASKTAGYLPPEAAAVEEHFAYGDASAWDSFIEQHDQGSGCDDIARAIEEEFGVPQVWGFYTLPGGQREPHSWNEMQGVIVDAGAYTMGSEYNGCRIYDRSSDPKAAAYGPASEDDSIWMAASKTASADASISPSADEHVFIATAGLWDRVLDKTMRVVEDNMKPELRADHTTGRAPSYDWCRFRKDRRCMFPKHLNEDATRSVGYAVWVPEDRGLCPRDQWDLQETCPVSQPGPKSGAPGALVDATVRWEDGGQRGGRPSQYPIDYANPFQSKKAAFEFTANWADVRTKARKIRTDGGVRIVAAPGTHESGLTITAEIKGENNIYETTVIREPGKRSVASWSCGCAWAAYSWGRSGRWKKFEGRMCSHALALTYEAQAQGMFGGTINEQPDTPPWRTSEPVSRHEKNPLGLAASLRPVALDPILQVAPAVLIAQAMLTEGHSKTAVAQAFGDDRIIAQAVTMKFPDLKALVRGVVRTVKYVFADEHSALVEGVGKVPVDDILYPTYHPTKGLTLPRMASLEEIQAHVLDGRDGPHIPGTEEHYPYDEQAYDPSTWGAFAFEAASQRIDIGEGRDVPFGHLNFGMGADFDYMASSGFLTDDPFGFEDPLNAYNDAPEPTPALPFTTGEEDEEAVAHTGSLAKEAVFDVPDGATPEEAADHLAASAAVHANFVTDLLRRLAKEHGCFMDGESFRLKKKPRMLEKIKQTMVKFHLRADEAAEQFQDALRFTMVLPPALYSEIADEVLDELADKGIRPMAIDLVKNYWLRGDPYDGLNTVLVLPDGFPFELQFHTQASLDLKMNNHEMYEEFRGSKGPITQARKALLWATMVKETYGLDRPPGLHQVGLPARHVFASAVRIVTYYGFKDPREPGSYRGVFRLTSGPDFISFERYSNSRKDWVRDDTLAGHLVKGDPMVDEISEGEAKVIIAVTRDLEGQALLDSLIARQAKVEHLHAEALVVDAIADPTTAPEMAEVITETLASSPPGPGDPRLAWLMSGASDGSATEGAGGGSPQTASNDDIAAQSKAFLAKSALKEFSPAEQQEIINEGMDVVASNLEDLDIRGTHYEGLEAALREHEDDEEWMA